MSTTVSFIILAVLIVAILVIFGISKFNERKHKDEIKKAEDDLAYITNKVSQTKQYLKYKNKVSLHSIIILASIIFASLTLILFIFVPIFQIKFELLGETVATKNFSLLDNYQYVKSNYNDRYNYFTDISSKSLLIDLLIIAASAIITIVCTYFCEYKPSNLEERTKKIFLEVKTDNYKYFDREKIFSILFIGICAIIVAIINCKNAEFNFKSDTPFTVTAIDNYLYYDFNNTALSCRVYQNYFKFCNGVSGYLALPIISFAIAVILYIVWRYSKVQLKKEIDAEKIEGFEEVTESEKSN